MNKQRDGGNTAPLKDEFTSSPTPGSTVSVATSARMKTYGNAAVSQQTRHARRVYVGGIPPMYTDEDGLRNFLNLVCAQGLGEDNDHSHVLSVYINHKKCFAFVELKTIELASACLKLDGIIFRNIVLRILRANEYKPELVPSHTSKELNFDLSRFQFGVPNAPAHYNTADTEEILPDKSLVNIIEYSTPQSILTEGRIVILGYPFDESKTSETGYRGLGCDYAPRCFRQCVRRFKYGSIDNPEYNIDLSKLKITDAGDILAGKSAEETRTNLSGAISELLMKGCVPFVIGGRNDLSYTSVTGLLDIAGSSIAVVVISSRIDLKLLDDMRFCTYSAGRSLPSCGGRYIQFAAQGSQCSLAEAQYALNREGEIMWLQKTLREKMKVLSVAEQFKTVLSDLVTKNVNLEQESVLPVVVTLDTGALSSSLTPLSNSSHSPTGLHLDEILEIVKLCGSHPNVVLMNLTEFSPHSEESRHNLLLADMFYQFSVGYSQRKCTKLRPKYLASHTSRVLHTTMSCAGSPSQEAQNISSNNTLASLSIAQIQDSILHSSLMRSNSYGDPVKSPQGIQGEAIGPPNVGNNTAPVRNAGQSFSRTLSDKSLSFPLHRASSFSAGHESLSNRNNFLPPSSQSSTNNQPLSSNAVHPHSASSISNSLPCQDASFTNHSSRPQSHILHLPSSMYNAQALYQTELRSSQVSIPPQNGNSGLHRHGSLHSASSYSSIPAGYSRSASLSTSTTRSSSHFLPQNLSMSSSANSLSTRSILGGAGPPHVSFTSTLPNASEFFYPGSGPFSPAYSNPHLSSPPNQIQHYQPRPVGYRGETSETERGSGDTRRGSSDVLDIHPFDEITDLSFPSDYPF